MIAGPSLKSRLDLWGKSHIPAGLQAWWGGVTESLWLLRALTTVLCAGMAFGLVQLDTRFDPDLTTNRNFLLYGGGTDGARGVLTAIASSVVTVTGTIFSIVIVALQLASGQFTPRVMRHFTGDRINQVVLAVMIGTFTYCLLVLRTIRGPENVGERFVPLVSVNVGILLSLFCIGALIVFVHHSAVQLQVSFILERAAEDTLRLVDETFPESQPDGAEVRAFEWPSEPPVVVTSLHSGYLQDIDLDHLCLEARYHEITMHVLHTKGMHILVGTPIVHVWTCTGGLDDATIRAIRTNLVIGVERTLLHDVSFGVRQITDIAIKALSPAINDPTTATQSIDQLCDLLVRAGIRQDQPRMVMVDRRPAIHLETVTFAMLVDISFTQLRRYGATDLVVAAHLLDGLRRISNLVPDRHRVVPHDHARIALMHAERATETVEEHTSLRELGSWIDQSAGVDRVALVDPDTLVFV